MATSSDLRSIVAALFFAVAPLGPAAAGPLPASASPAAPRAAAKVFLTMDEALKLAFPGCDVERGKELLSKPERKRAAELAGSKLESPIAYPYVASKNGVRVGTAYFDAHRVRTLRETIMVVVAPDDTIQRLEVLAFAEPLDYLPRGEWYGQFRGKRLDDELSTKRGIRGVTGATLTARATTRAARRVLAVHRVLAERVPTPTHP